MRGLARLGRLALAAAAAAAEGRQLGGDLLLQPHRPVQLVGGAEEVKRHLGLQRQAGRARLPPQRHLWPLGVIGRCHRQAAARQRLLEQRQVGDSGGQAGGEELPVETAGKRSHLEEEE